MNILPGENIPLVAQLECYDGETVYIDVILKKPDRTSLPGSPVDLTDEGDGIFFDDSLQMPDEEFITATYTVYTDISKTTLSDLFCSITDTFVRRVDLRETRLDLIGDLETNAVISAIIEADEPISGGLEEEITEGELLSGSIDTELDENVLTGTLGDCND